MVASSAGRYVRTLAHIPPRQVLHRLALRSRRVWYRRHPDGLEAIWAADAPEGGGWPGLYRPLDAVARHAGPSFTPSGRGSIRAVGEECDVLADGWRASDHTQLFRYHLHYFEWAWGLVSESDGRGQFETLWRSWRSDTVAGRWDEWSPYVVSLRAWTLCGVFDSLVRGSPVERDVLAHLRACLGFLSRNLELDVRGNHLMKNLKAIFGLRVFFALEFGRELTQLLSTEVRTQVLDDGGHFELSPGYHAQVMADLVDIVSLCDAADREVPIAAEVLARMGGWLAAVSYPDGSIPLLGDCSPPSPNVLAALRTYAPDADQPKCVVLESTGLVVLRPNIDTMAVFDFGPPCPPELPAHAQADWGTFEVWHAGARVIVDPGVSTYVGPRRRWERSTAAHNTVCIGGEDSTEVWGSFRAGRLGAAEIVAVTVGGDDSDEVVVTARQYGYRHLAGRPVHVREVRITPTSLQVMDRIESEGPVSAESSITVAHGVLPEWVRPTTSCGAADVDVADGFGSLVPATRLTQMLDGQLTVGWVLDLSDESKMVTR